MGELMTLAMIGLGTYAMRAVFLVTARHRPSPHLTRLLPHIGPAVLAAIALPAFVAPRGSISFVGTVSALLAAVSASVTWRSAKHNLPIALFAGLAVWWLASWALGAA
jgi:branched-subunit amino acid transport protein